MKRTFLFSIILVVSLGSFAQNNLPEGAEYKKKTTDKDVIIYEGYFINNHPVGELKRYHQNGKVKAIMIYDNEGKSADTKMFYDTGKKASEGLYLNKQKHGEWLYYSYYTDSLTARENYKMGIKDGMSYSYYSTGAVCKKIKWINNKKEGAWIELFDDGKRKLISNYNNDKIHGKYNTWFPNDQIETAGEYKNNLKHGHWVYYKPNGEILKEVNYNNGVPDADEELLLQETKEINKMESMKGKFKDPNKY